MRNLIVLFVLIVPGTFAASDVICRLLGLGICSNQE